MGARSQLHVLEDLCPHVEDQALTDPGGEPAGAKGQRRVQDSQPGDDGGQLNNHPGGAVAADLVDDVACQ